MTRQLTILTLTLTICLTSFGQTNIKSQNHEKQSNAIQVDTSVIAILPFDTNSHWIFKDGKNITLSADELLTVEDILKKCITNYNPDQEKQFEKINKEHPEYKLDKKHFVIDLTKYKRQYVAIINSKGEKEVWVNCFCNTRDKNWKTNLVFVIDGGNCYFNLKINLTTGQYFELMVNGDA